MMRACQHLWQGHMGDVPSSLGFQTAGIRYILNCAVDVNYLTPNGIGLLHLPLVDGQPIAERHIVMALVFLETASPEPTLVHCAAGISRSGAMIAAFLRHQKAVPTVDDAIREAQRILPHIAPHPVLVASLKGYFGEP